MHAIFRKEINVFFSSLIGYIAITIFLVANGLISWIFPDTNIFDGGYAVLDTFFMWAPWIFLFLIPAITMRSFAEENSTGTFEFLDNWPVKYMQFIACNYFAACVLVFFSVIAT
ncbi:MAG: gliding motility-associated ABC transporter permease subunit GldF, partial [Chitinophagales bacterium]|nr:gliding motility-associated ABC transporter permease subunit GldF [Chitinophagales bacterium]